VKELKEHSLWNIVQDLRLARRPVDETTLTGCSSDLRECARSLDRKTTGTKTKRVISKEPSIFPPSFITRKNDPVKGKAGQKTDHLPGTLPQGRIFPTGAPMVSIYSLTGASSTFLTAQSSDLAHGLATLRLFSKASGKRSSFMTPTAIDLQHYRNSHHLIQDRVGPTCQV
jgi:hypothetical protein